MIKHIPKMWFLPCGTCSPRVKLCPFLLTPLSHLHLPQWVFTKVKKHVFLLSSFPSHINHSLLNSHLYLKKHIFMHLSHTPLLLPVSLSVYPTSPPRLFSLVKHLSTHHSFIRQQRGIEERGHSAEWSKLANAFSTIGMERMSGKKGWERREGNCNKMQSSWKGEADAGSGYLLHIFYSSFTAFLTPSSACLHVSFLCLLNTLVVYQTLPLFPQ